jgi:phosphoribosylformimino-5-aminoimidazole carboxamide ribotide isomerase
MELLAAIDLRDSTAVRLVQGDFARQHDYGDPLAMARRYVEGGARWLHVVDLDAARTGEPLNRPTVLAIAREAGVPVETGGGVRTEGDVAELLEGGVTRVVLGTAALEDPSLAVRCARRYPGRVAVGLDYRRHPDGRTELASRGWLEGSGTALGDLLAALEGAPVGAVVVTAIERDGTFAGPDLVGLADVLDAAACPVVASGGVGTLEDLRALAALAGPASGRRLEGVVVGKALADGRLGVQEALQACAPSG